MIERTEEKVQQKSTHKKERKNNNNETSYVNLHIILPKIWLVRVTQTVSVKLKIVA